MTKNIISIPSDLEVRCLLRDNDPAQCVTEAFLAELEQDILEKTRGVEQMSAMLDPWSFGPGFSRVAAFAATLVLVLGFGVGQTFYPDSAETYSGRLSLIALADDASQSVLTSSWGDYSDDVE